MPAPTQAPTPTATSKPTLIFSDLDWPTANIQNHVARAILELGYGYETAAVYGGTVPLAQALLRGETNITMEIWLPNQQAWLDQAIASGDVTSLGKSLEDVWQSAFIIPQYVADAYPGLQTPQDLMNPEYRELFAGPNSGGKAMLIGCLAGWECETVNKRKIEAYGLEDFVVHTVPGRFGSLERRIRNAFENRDPILFFYWGPTILSEDLETDHGGFKILEEPPYSAECWAEYVCQYPTAEVYIVVRTELLQTAPDAVEFLRKWDFHAGIQIPAERYLEETGADDPEVAIWVLLNTTDWYDWVTPEARDKVLAALAE